MSVIVYWNLYVLKMCTVLLDHKILQFFYFSEAELDAKLSFLGNAMKRVGKKKASGLLLEVFCYDAVLDCRLRVVSSLLSENRLFA